MAIERSTPPVTTIADTSLVHLTILLILLPWDLKLALLCPAKRGIKRAIALPPDERCGPPATPGRPLREKAVARHAIAKWPPDDTMGRMRGLAGSMRFFRPFRGSMSESTPSLFDAVGGLETFIRLVAAFYRRVETDPLLRPMYPADLTESREHLALFLAQYFGGPATYSAQRGHPRLRRRHFPFTIDQQARDAWLTHMRAAVEETALPEPSRSAMLAYFEQTANFLVNA
jgi:hemoglobin